MSNSKFIVIIAISAGAAGILAAVFLLFPTNTTSGEYGIMVDPTKEKQSLFIMARVSIENTRTLPLTNVRVNLIYVFHMKSFQPGENRCQILDSPKRFFGYC